MSTPTFCYMYVPHSMDLFHDDPWLVNIWDFGFWENKIFFFLFMRIPLKGYIEEEAIWKSEELSVFINLIFLRYGTFSSDLSNRIPRAIYPSNPMYSLYLFRENTILICYVWYVILSICIQYGMFILKKPKIFPPIR